MHLAYIWIVSHLSVKNYQNWLKFDEVLTKTNLLSFFGTRCTVQGENAPSTVLDLFSSRTSNHPVLVPPIGLAD